MLGCINTFFGGHVCQCLAGCAIANGINAGHIGLPVCINNYFSFIGFYAQRFKSYVFDIGNNTNGA